MTEQSKEKINYDYEDRHDFDPIYLISLCCAVLAFMLSISLWQKMQEHEHAIIQEILNEENILIQQAIKSNLNSSVLALRRKAQRWETRGGTPRYEWEQDALRYIEDNVGLKIVQWVDETYHTKWVVPLKGNEDDQNTSVVRDYFSTNALAEVSRKGQITLTTPMRLENENFAFRSYVPIYIGETFKGFIVGIYDIYNLLNAVIPTEFKKLFNIEITDGDLQIYLQGADDLQHKSEWAIRQDVQFFNRTWTISLWPKSTFLDYHQSFLAELVLTAGFIVSLLIGFVVFYAYSANRRSQLLYENEGFLNLLINNIPDFVFVKDNEFRIVQANPAFLNVYPENERESIIGTTTVEQYNEKEAEKFLEKDKEALKTGASETEETIHFPDGKIRTLITKKVRFENAKGKQYILGVANDISDRKKAEEDLLSMGHIVENSLNEIYVFREDNLKFIQVNHGARLNLGYSMDELKTMTPIDIKIEFFEDAFHTLISPLRNGEEEKIIFETKHQRKDESLYDVEVHLQMSNYQDKKVFVATISDITERKKAEEELQQMNQELDEFAYRTSHDLRAPVVSALSLLELIQNLIKRGNQKEAIKGIEHAQTSLDQLRTFIDEVLQHTFTKFNQEEDQKLDFEEILNETMQKLSHMQGYDTIEFIINLDFKDQLITKKNRLALILENLLSNAVKYQDTNKENSYIKINTYEEADKFVLSITDNGIGIPKDQQENIFQMFKRFHPKVAFGSGLGLYLIKKSADFLGGTIEYNDQEGGTCFTLKIPVG